MMGARTPCVDISYQIHYQRFRYGAENRCGRRRNDESIIKVKVTNVMKGSKLKIFCVKSRGDKPHPHPNSLDGAGCSAGVYCHPDFPTDVHSQEISIPWLQINRIKKRSMVAELEKRKEFLPLEFIAGYEAVLDQLGRKEEQIKSTDVRLCAHLTVPITQSQVYTTYKLSSLIKHDEKGTSLKIDSLSLMSASVLGQDLTHIFTSEDSPAIEPDSVEVRMEERDDDGHVVWRSVPFVAQKNDIRYKQVIFYPVPAYRDTDITQPITVLLIVRCCCTDLEDSKQFIYQPTVEAVKLWQGKRKALSPLGDTPFKFIRGNDEMSVKAQLHQALMQKSDPTQGWNLVVPGQQSPHMDLTTSGPALASLPVEGMDIAVPSSTRYLEPIATSSGGSHESNINTDIVYGTTTSASVGGHGLNMATSVGLQGSYIVTSVEDQGSNMFSSTGSQGSNMVTSMGGQGSNIAMSMGGQGSNMATFLGGHLSNMATSMGGQGSIMASSLGGQGSNMFTSMGGQGSNMATSMGGQGSNMATSMGGQGSIMASSLGGQGSNMANSMGGQALTNVVLSSLGQGLNIGSPAKGQALTNIASHFARTNGLSVTALNNPPSTMTTPYIVAAQPGQGGGPGSVQEWPPGQEHPGTSVESSLQVNNKMTDDGHVQQGNSSETLSNGLGDLASSKEQEKPATTPRFTRIKLIKEKPENQGNFRCFMRWPTPKGSTEDQMAQTKEPSTNQRPNVDKLEMMRRQMNRPSPQQSEDHFQPGADQTQAITSPDLQFSDLDQGMTNKNQPSSSSQPLTDPQSRSGVAEAPGPSPDDSLSPQGPVNRGRPSNLTLPAPGECNESGVTPTSTGSLPSLFSPLNLPSLDLLSALDISVFEQV